jgi:hypothetical protein
MGTLKNVSIAKIIPWGKPGSIVVLFDEFVLKNLRYLSIDYLLILGF